MRLQVIGYGNELRGDDAAGPLIAEEIAGWQLPNVATIACRQLTPELAATLAQSDHAIFIDAYASDGAGEVHLREIGPAPLGDLSNHQCDPAALLLLAEILYGTFPRAHWLLIPAEQFAHGAGLSEATRRGVERAIAIVRALIPAVETDHAAQPPALSAQGHLAGARCD